MRNANILANANINMLLFSFSIVLKINKSRAQIKSQKPIHATEISINA